MLSDDVKKLALEYIRQGNWLYTLFGMRVAVEEGDDLLLRWLIQNGIIKKTEFEQAIHQGLCACGRRCYLWTQNNPALNRPDHSLAPEAIGWALMHKAISYEEGLLMKFDHGETIESYILSAYDLLDWAIAEFNKPYVPDLFEPSKSLHKDADSCCLHD